MKSPRLNKKQENELRNVILLNKHSSREVKRAQAIVLVDKEIKLADIYNLTGLKRSQVWRHFRRGVFATLRKALGHVPSMTPAIANTSTLFLPKHLDLGS